MKTDSMEVNIISPTQVSPGTVMRIRVSFINTQEIRSFQVGSMNPVDTIKYLKNIIKKDKIEIMMDTYKL